MQFSHISEGGVLRTTPTQSPRISRSLGSNETGKSVDSKVAASSRETYPSGDQRGELVKDEQVSQTEHQDPVSGAEPTPPHNQKAVNSLPSILKKTAPGSAAQSSKTAKILSPVSGVSHNAGIDDREGVLLPMNVSFAQDSGPSAQAHQPSFREEQEIPNLAAEMVSSRRISGRERGTTKEKPTALPEEAKQRSTGKRTVLAKTGASKRRPTIIPRKSSQSSSSIASNVTISSALDTKPGSPVRAQGLQPYPKGSALEEEQPVMQRSRQEIPRSSQRRSAATNNVSKSSESQGKSRNEANEVEDGLVERDFRLRFAARTQMERQSFAPFTAKSTTTAAATAADHQAIGITDTTPPQRSRGNGKWMEEFTDEIVHLKPPGSSGPRAKDDNEAQPLPRTKSQLTLLLERDRQRGHDGRNGKEARQRQ